MTDHELVEKTANIIVSAYRDEKIDFTGFGSQCDWIGYQVRHLFIENKRLPETEGQMRLDLSAGSAKERQTQYIDNGFTRGYTPAKGGYCFD